MYRFSEDAKKGFVEYSGIIYAVNTREPVADLVSRAEAAYQLMAPCLNGQKKDFKAAIDEANYLNQIRMGKKIFEVYLEHAEIGGIKAALKAVNHSDELVSRVSRELERMRPQVLDECPAE